MKYTKILLISLLLLVMLSSCGKSNGEKDDIFYGYNQESESTSEQSSYTIDGQNVSADSFEIHIPEEYSLTDNGSSLRIENENNSFDISIEEHKYTGDSFEKYLSETLEGYSQIGAEVSEPEAVTIGNYEMQRVKLSFMPMQAYGYFVDQGDKAFLISVVSNVEEMSHNESDAFIERVCISF
jgi:hypothetical protein